MEAAVFLDRDNTLIANDGDLGDPARVHLMDGVPAGLRALHEAGYRLIVITNQGGVARGKYTEDDVDAVNQHIARLVDEQAGASSIIDRFYYCPYHPEATVEAYRREHPWRKPNPGMLLQAAHDLGIDLAHSWLIGDQARDISAGRRAGCRTVLITTDEESAHEAHATGAVPSFADAVRHVLQATPNGASRRSEAGGIADDSPAKEKAASGPLHRAILELTEEIRSERMRRVEFTYLRMTALGCELLVILMAVLGLLQLDAHWEFMKWMIGAGLLQLFVMALLLLDLKS